jgi:hypothetical protein
MRNKFRSSAAGALCIALAAMASAGAASAGPINIVSSAVVKSPLTEQIRCCRYYHPRHYGGDYHREYGPAFYPGYPNYQYRYPVYGFAPYWYGPAYGYAW